MADGSGVSGARYRAFISYSHRDAVFAARLHRRLEGYVLPKRLGAGRRLTPIFKDREELPAAHDLSAQVRAALAASDCLIVVCSPDAAASPWVGREIALFRELHPERPILAALIRGEPAEAFPPALAAGGVEPLAADFRKEADGERLALLKLVAGIAAVGVDQLVQRDAQRRMQGVMAVTAVAVAGMLAMGGMTAVALQARAEAERQRAEAEGLVEFMLSDLRAGIKDVADLQILTKINERTLDYYNRQPRSALSNTSLLRIAKIKLLTGEDKANRMQDHLAARDYSEAYDISSKLLRAEPGHHEALWTLAQSAYGLGYIRYKAGDYAGAKQRWLEYRRLAGEYRSLLPNSAKSLREVAFAESNLCILYIEQEKNSAKAIEACQAALDDMIASAGAAANSDENVLLIANQRGWMADAEELAGDHDKARHLRLQQESEMVVLLRKDSRNRTAWDNWAAAQRALGRLAHLSGDDHEASRRLELAQSAIRMLTTADGEQKLRAANLKRLDRELRSILQDEQRNSSP